MLNLKGGCFAVWNQLQHALNSMFRWYRSAAKCYVYLTDVSTCTPDDESSWEAAFQASKWFTRGWTLQELIAPTIVEFFSIEGNRLGLEFQERHHPP